MCATGERVSVLEGIGAALDKPLAEKKARGRGVKAGPEAAGKTMEASDRNRDAGPEMAPEPRQKSVEMDFGAVMYIGFDPEPPFTPRREAR